MAVALIAIGAMAITVLSNSIARTQSSASRLQHSLGRPQDHLSEVARAVRAGHDEIEAGAGSTGLERTRHLSQAVVEAQLASNAWTEYTSSAAGLTGEKKLAQRYVADQELARSTASASLISIVQASAAATVPRNLLDAQHTVDLDVDSLRTLYRQAEQSELKRLGSDARHSADLLQVGSLVALVIVAGGMLLALRRARQTVIDRGERTDAEALASFETRLRRALSLVDTNGSAFSVGERAIAEMLPGVRASLLVADSSRSRLTPVRELPTCGVNSPEECPALRSGATVSFEDSEALDACPTLAANTESRCSATCVPIAVAGRGAAVLHLAGSPGRPPTGQGATDLVARGVGDRVTLLQALATFQLQAERDPLTGLLNRRSLQSSVEQLIGGDRQYSVAFGDLDHFKRVNDTHGHEAGDRALRAFARTLRESLRPQDVAGRWGGEEFLVVLPDCDAAAAVEAMERVRTNQALGALAGHTAAVTASFGVAHSSDGASFDEVVERADAALRQAKENGRNQVIRYTLGGRSADDLVRTHPSA